MGLVHCQQRDIQQEGGLLLFQVLQSGTQFELTRVAGEVIVVGHIAQFHVFIVGHITCQFACRCITGDTYPRRETPMTVEEVAVTEVYFIPQFCVAFAFLFKTFDLVVQLVTEGRGADTARYRQVRGLRCIFLFLPVVLAVFLTLALLLLAVVILATFSATRFLLGRNGGGKAACCE